MSLIELGIKSEVAERLPVLSEASVAEFVEYVIAFTPEATMQDQESALLTNQVVREPIYLSPSDSEDLAMSRKLRLRSRFGAEY